MLIKSFSSSYYILYPLLLETATHGILHAGKPPHYFMQILEKTSTEILVLHHYDGKINVFIFTYL